MLKFGVFLLLEVGHYVILSSYNVIDLPNIIYMISVALNSNIVLYIMLTSTIPAIFY